MTTPYELFYEQLEPLLQQTARGMHRRNRWVEYDDLYQTAAWWCVKHPRKLEEYLTDEDARKGVKQLLTALYNECRDYIRAERHHRFGQHPDEDAFYYPMKVLKDELLPAYYDPEAWLSPPQIENSGGSGKQDPAYGNNWLATLSDIGAAIEGLSNSAQLILLCRFREQWSLERIADEYAYSESTAQRRVDSAVRQIQDALGGPKPFRDPAEEAWEDYICTGGVLSNSQARYLTDNPYEQEK